jgi:hypothetical protein
MEMAYRQQWEAIAEMRRVLGGFAMEEECKWGKPTYRVDGKNVVINDTSGATAPGRNCGPTCAPPLNVAAVRVYLLDPTATPITSYRAPNSRPATPTKARDG